MRRRRAVLSLVAAVAALGTGTATPAAPAYASPGCPAGLSPPPAQPVNTPPWPQQRYDLARLAGIADGSGITVAVIDSGVDASQAQLAGRVLAGVDELVPGGDGRQDCVGHGTAVASIIAAASGSGGAALRGVAPGARILPVRVTEHVEGDTGAARGTAGDLAAGIRAAVDSGARVLNISVVLPDDASVAEQIRYAVARGVVVVAAVGNDHRSDGGPDPVPYPAAYPGVIGVGAIDVDGQRLPQSQVGGYVGLAAPGSAIVAAAVPDGLATFSGTSFAAPFVAGAAALVLQRWPQLSAAQVAARLYATADPAPDGGHSTNYGYGIVNPYRAVTAALAQPAGTAVARPPVPPPTLVPATHPNRFGPALPLAGGGAILLAVLLAFALVLPRATARGWRPGG